MKAKILETSDLSQNVDQATVDAAIYKLMASFDEDYLCGCSLYTDTSKALK